MAASPGGIPPVIPGLSPDMSYMVGTLGFGGIAGWSVGYTLKKVAKVVALIIGVVFIGIQVLAANHFIAIDWQKIQATVPDKSLQDAASAGMGMLTYNLPFAGAFLLGFAAGFRSG